MRSRAHRWASSLAPSSPHPAPLFLITVFYNGFNNQGTVWTGCVAPSCREAAWECPHLRHSEARCPKLKIPTKSVLGSLCGQAAGSGRRAVLEGASLTQGSRVYPTISLHSHLARSFPGEACRTVGIGLTRLPRMDRKMPVAVLRGDAAELGTEVLVSSAAGCPGVPLLRGWTLHQTEPALSPVSSHQHLPE